MADIIEIDENIYVADIGTRFTAVGSNYFEGAKKICADNGLKVPEAQEFLDILASNEHLKNGLYRDANTFYWTSETHPTHANGIYSLCDPSDAYGVGGVSILLYKGNLPSSYFKLIDTSTVVKVATACHYKTHPNTSIKTLCIPR